MTELEEESIQFHDALEDVEEEESDEEDVKADPELTQLRQEKVKVAQHMSKIRTKKVVWLACTLKLNKSLSTPFPFSVVNCIDKYLPNHKN